MTTRITTIRQEVYDYAEYTGQVVVGTRKFHLQPMEDCLPEFYITDLTTGEFLGSDLTPSMFRRYANDQALREFHKQFIEEEAAE